MSEQSEQNKELLKKVGLKITEPRLTILALMQDSRENMQHFAAEDIYKLLLEHKSEVGLATVYRVLNQFEEVGILTRHSFDSNKAVFELNYDHQHDHIICKDCGKVFEFKDDEIERRQREISQKHGIELEKHSLYLYGTCSDLSHCDNKEK
ncbi:ferric iron uptake transcriptional regulator [Pasteurella atlantica]|uniref:Ferric uptake regulation protein n=3 Tax=Pasteurellaceae TaxID=712 RepID=A0AAQ4LTT4_9PAST|nr:ferric iron uptake transcriptional regulator [Pasteurella atlantica]MBR0573516.1 ferric iron uptake transcriptional regulator [Pasteurella atlantica]MDP8034036.1 ferric iron uptake transcriptional regulator [Pasteurella atlantica]MDP8035933.1 ferric iron uptake transcriptional regulator [Pasteurella atlantica]MDP8037883.1 ferric iron uptake transcriptional regulator [Pasteurella atlantica]MDP8039517.1 ferric iron uptake transcriptional regulator [Pasteurella atlantica]